MKKKLNIDNNIDEEETIIQSFNNKPDEITVHFKNSNYDRKTSFKVNINEKVLDLINRYRETVINDLNTYTYIFKNEKLNLSLTLKQAGLYNGCEILVIQTNYIKEDEDSRNKLEYNKIYIQKIETEDKYAKEINIKFLKIMNGYYNKIYDCQLTGLLKLCLLKEISSILTQDRCKNLDALTSLILRILSNGYIIQNNDKENIKQILNKIKGSNIINFSNFVDEEINLNKMNKIISLLTQQEFIKINDIRYRLSKYNHYMKLFNNEFKKAIRKSIFEFSVISVAIIEREDFEKFETERNRCPNRVERILYHGTDVEPISGILTSLYRKSIGPQKAILGDGVYFTDLLDYAWYYGGQGGNRKNISKIPKVDDVFSVIINAIYYDKNGCQQVWDRKRTPGKNKINFGYAGARTNILTKSDITKFYATEYVINDLDQICPFMSAKLKRVEYCIIWRDTNFSSKPIYNNDYDKIFKNFLKERLKYINQQSNYNVYPCESSEEALELVKRKKYNKIVLISNIGEDYGGKFFVENARKIIGNNVITLFLAAKRSHLNWIKDFTNAIFSNEPEFDEEFLLCFNGNNIEYNIKCLVNKLEKYYKVKFNFDEIFLYYPHFMEEGSYQNLIF